MKKSKRGGRERRDKSKGLEMRLQEKVKDRESGRGAQARQGIGLVTQPLMGAGLHGRPLPSPAAGPGA